MVNDHLRLVVDNSGERELQALFEETGQALEAAKGALRRLADQVDRSPLEDTPARVRQAEAFRALQVATTTVDDAQKTLEPRPKRPADIA